MVTQGQEGVVRRAMTEIAWDAKGNYCGDDVPHPEAMPDIDVAHSHSGECHHGAARFICDACGRVVPWCFGGCDDSLCDDCWAEVQS